MSVRSPANRPDVISASLQFHLRKHFDGLSEAVGGGIRLAPVQVDGVVMSAKNRMLQLAHKNENQ